MTHFKWTPVVLRTGVEQLDRLRNVRPINTVNYYRRGPAYRYFPSAEWARHFADGGIRLSTLQACRDSDDPKRADSDEATQHYFSGHVTGDSDSSPVDLIAARVGLQTGGCAKNLTISNCKATTLVTDAFLLCFSLADDAGLREKFGKYVVRVQDTQTFIHQVGLRLHDVVPIDSAIIGPVQYSPRSYSGVEDPPIGKIAFTKDPERFAAEKELRMLWVIARHDPLEQPFEVHCPDVTSLCETLF